MKNFIIIFISSSLCYCNIQDVNNKEKRIELKNGGYAFIPYVINQDGDTLIQGIGKYYSSEGKLTDEIEFKNSKKNGWHKVYDSEKIYSKIYFIDNLASGKAFFYNKSGKINSESYYERDQIRTTAFFDSSGIVRLINFFDDTTVFYAVKYDNLGKKIGEKGVVFAYNFIYNQNPDSVRIGTLFEVKIPVVVLPGHITNIEAVVFNSENEISEVVDSLPIRNFFAFFRIFFDEPGQKILGIAGELRTIDGMFVRKDTLYKVINVINNKNN